MPMPKPVCRTTLHNKIVQLEVCRTFSGRGMGINGTAQLPLAAPRTLRGSLPSQLALGDGLLAPSVVRMYCVICIYIYIYIFIYLFICMYIYIYIYYVYVYVSLSLSLSLSLYLYISHSIYIYRERET